MPTTLSLFAECERRLVAVEVSSQRTIEWVATAADAAHHHRQAAPGAIQCRFSEGTIDFPRAMDQLIEGAYQGYAAFEYVWEQWMDNDRVDVLSETLLLRRQLQQFITDEHPAG